MSLLKVAKTIGVQCVRIKRQMCIFKLLKVFVTNILECVFHWPESITTVIFMIFDNHQ